MRRALAAALCACACVAPCAGFQGLLYHGLDKRPAPAASCRARGGARPGLRMSFDADAQAQARAKALEREAAREEKRRQRAARERETRDREREVDRQLVMGGGAAFVASQQSSGELMGGSGRPVAAASTFSPEAVEQNLAAIEQGVPGKNPGKLAKVLKKRSGQLAVALEYKREAAVDDDDVNHVDMRRYSVKLRELKLDVLFCNIATKWGLDDCASFVAEQASAKGSFPGPVPVVATGITSKTGVAEAAALGCKAALVSYEDVDDADALVQACLTLSLEPVAMVGAEAQVESAVAAGAKILCTAPRGPPDFSAPVAAQEAKALKAKFPKDVVAVAGLDAHVGGPPSEVFAPSVDQTAIEMGEVKDPLCAHACVYECMCKNPCIFAFDVDTHHTCVGHRLGRLRRLFV